MTKDDILEYLGESPSNTNPAVISGMLDSFAKGDNKEEIELTATENKVYTPDEGKVYKKVTVNVPVSPGEMPDGVATILEHDTTYGENQFVVTQQGNDKFVILDDTCAVTDQVVADKTVTVYVPQQELAYLIPTEHTGYYTLSNETPK